MPKPLDILKAAQKASAGTTFASSPLAFLTNFETLRQAGQKGLGDLLSLLTGGGISQSNAVRSAAAAQGERFRARTGSRAGSLASTAAAGMFGTQAASDIASQKQSDALQNAQVLLSLFSSAGQPVPQPTKKKRSVRSTAGGGFGFSGGGFRKTVPLRGRVSEAAARFGVRTGSTR